MKRISVFAAMLLLALSTAAQASDAIKNWAAPSSWTPPSAHGASRSALVTYPPLPFIPLDPCRVIDTRLASFPAGYGPPSMAGGGTQRTFTITGQCGVPAGAQAVSFNFAVWAPPTRGDLRVFPAGGPTPTVSTLNWEAGILALANAAVVPLGAGGAITVQIDGPGTVDIFVDINGYYTSSVASDQAFVVTTPGPYAVVGNAAGAGVWGLGGIYGVAGTSSLTAAVYGQASGTAIGVYGTASATNGVRGISSGAGVAGVLGQNGNNADGTHGVGGLATGTGIVFGVQGQITAAGAAGSAGVHGIGASATGKTYAVLGETSDTTGNSAAVQGLITGTGAMVGNTGSWVPAGIRGDAADTGVWGFANTYGVFGRAFTTGGVDAGFGILGNNQGTTTYGVRGNAGTSGTTNWAIFAVGNMGASGTKPFIEPHPHQAGMVIRYVALEGAEAGTYFRGRGRFVGRQAVIDVPEDFRLVTDTEGLSIQVTPIGDLSQVAVVSLGLDTIELKSSRDVEFFYHVNGVRRTFKDWKVMVSGTEFQPDGPSAKMPDGLSAEQRRSLIRNGTYNEDGTVNLSTARRLGWDVEWSSRGSQDFGKVVPKAEK